MSQMVPKGFPFTQHDANTRLCHFVQLKLVHTACSACCKSGQLHQCIVKGMPATNLFILVIIRAGLRVAAMAVMMFRLDSCFLPVP